MQQIPFSYLLIDFLYAVSDFGLHRFSEEKKKIGKVRKSIPEVTYIRGIPSSRAL